MFITNPGYNGTQLEVDQIRRDICGLSLPSHFPPNGKARILFVSSLETEPMATHVINCVESSLGGSSILRCATDARAHRITPHLRTVELPNCRLSAAQVTGVPRDVSKEVFQQILQPCIAGTLFPAPANLGEGGSDKCVVALNTPVAFIMVCTHEESSHECIREKYHWLAAEALRSSTIPLLVLVGAESKHAAEVKTADPMTLFKSQLVEEDVKSLSGALDMNLHNIFRLMLPVCASLTPLQHRMHLDPIALVAANLGLILRSRVSDGKDADYIP